MSGFNVIFTKVSQERNLQKNNSVIKYFSLRNIAVWGGDDMKSQQQARAFIDLVMGLKKQHFHSMIKEEGYTQNEKLVLYLIHETLKRTKEDKVSLSHLRKRIQLAPSTVTPILNSLENKGVIQRLIDPLDRRNIFVKLSEKGISYTSQVYQELEKVIETYIEYMGEEDMDQFIRLIKKTNEFFLERKGKNEKNS